MDENCNLQIQALQMMQEKQCEQIGILFRKQLETDIALADIKQIKYILLGAIGFFVLQNMGILEAIKLMS